MIEYGDHEEQYVDVCKYYRRLYDTPSLQAVEEEWARVLRGAALYAVLAPHGNEQSDLLHRIADDKNLAKLPVTKCAPLPSLPSASLHAHAHTSMRARVCVCAFVHAGRWWHALRRPS
jgi:hypothetical protein